MQAPPEREVRRVGREGAAFLAALHSRMFSRDDAWDEKSFAALLSLPGVEGWAGFLDGQPVALLLSRHTADEWEILTLGVLPGCRRGGWAQALLDPVLEGAEARAESVFLEVSVTNVPAAALYEKLGFRRVGRRKAYYPDGSDADVLVRAS